MKIISLKELLCKITIIHPILLAIYPILFLYSVNVNEVTFKQIVLPCTISLILFSFLWLSLNLIIKNINKSGFFITILILFFYLYGHIFEYIEYKRIFIPIYRHKQLIPLIIIIWGYLVYFLRKINNFNTITKFLNLISIVLIIFNSINIIISAVNNFNSNSNTSSTKIAAKTNTNIIPQELTDINNKKNLPDIYYIILDGHPSSETLKKIYKYNNNTFDNHLKDKGFFIASKSIVRYSSTFQSLSSSLNMEYINDKIPLKDLFINVLTNKVSNFLKSKGYTYYYISDQRLNDGNYTNPYADFDLDKLKKGDKITMDFINPFNQMLIKTTMLRFYYYKLIKNGLKHRKNEFLKLDILKKVSAKKGPKYVFSHHLLSHAPFVFSADGGLVNYENHYNWKNKKYFLDSYIFSCKEIHKLIDTIINNSEKPPIIIIQSDHGPRGGQGANMNPNKLKISKDDWQKIYNAYYFPDEEHKKHLYKSISPVNTFRLIFNLYFNQNYIFLDD